MTKEELIKNIGKMEQVIDALLDITFGYMDNNTYMMLRYYFTQSDYEQMLQLLGKENN